MCRCVRACLLYTSQYASLDDLCDDLNVLSVELEEKLGEIGYFYNAKENRFV